MNNAFLSAYKRGRKAYKDNTDCPYFDKRTSYKNGNTFSRAFIKYWREGFSDEREGLPMRYTNIGKNV